MIPLRVYVKGFMSYRDETEFRFDGASLWVLAGRNGVGKSAVFDAITFALYGAHRGGKQNASELINQGADNLIVEFDFASGDERYRVKRTLSRKRSAATCQAFRLTGSNASPSAIANTDKRTELERWSEKVVGLSFETFTASVLLQQNKSDRLLSVGAADRHQMIAQLVDLSAYIRLYERIDELQKDLERSARLHQQELQKIEPVDEVVLASLNGVIDELGKQIEDAVTHLSHLSALKAQAKQWSSLSTRYDGINKKLSETYSILAQAEDIERKTNRLKLVQGNLPHLERLAQHQEQLEAKDVTIIGYQEQILCWSKNRAEADRLRIEAQNAVNSLKNQQQECRQEKDQAQQNLLELSPHMQRIKQLEDTRRNAVMLDAALARFPIDLEQRLRDLLQETNILNELNNALPWLKQYVGARQEWQAATKTLQDTRSKAERNTILLATTREKYTNIREHVRVTQDTIQQAHQEQTRAETLLGKAKEHLAHFKEVDGQTNCSYCGQRLTADHLEKERTRLETEVRDAQDAFMIAQQHYETMAEEQRELKEDEQRIAEEVRELEEEERGVRQTLQDARKAQERGIQQANGAINALPDNYKLSIMATPSSDITTCFTFEYPTQAELDTFDKRVATLKPKSKELREVQGQNDERHPLLIKRETVTEQIRLLEEEYSPGREQEICDQFQRADMVCKNAEQKQQGIDKDMQAAELTRDNAEIAFQEAEQQVRIITNKKSLEEARKEELQKAIADQLTELPDSWLEIATATAQRMQKHVEDLRAEADTLVDAEEQYELLIEAQRDRKYQEDLKSDIEQDMNQIEQDARRPLVLIEKEEQDAQAAHREKTKVYGKAEHEKREMESRRDRRKEVECQRLETVRKASLYKRLAHLLGPDCLQNHLLLQAQAGIVAHANETLGRISGGALRIELRQYEEGEGKARAKTLDLVAYNSDIGSEPLPVAFLSGSQKFRVAVGLALGIGQYTNAGTRQIESVIIDEGFGSLDREGREEMIHELRLLKGVLQRIILVSHQEEFVDAFDNGYAIELVNGVSKVSLR